MNNRVWYFRFSYPVVCFLITALGVDYLGTFLRGLFHIPMWLSCIGTIASAVVTGPIGGMIVGICSPTIYAIIHTTSIEYSLITVIIGLFTGILARWKFWGSASKALVLTLAISILSAIVATSLVILFEEPGNSFKWSAAIFQSVKASGYSIWIATFVSRFIENIADKAVCMFIVCYCWNHISLMRRVH